MLSAPQIAAMHVDQEQEAARRTLLAKRLQQQRK
jgi:hypothetical protein